MEFASLQLTFGNLETKIKNLEQNITNEDKFKKYKTGKDKIQNSYNNIATGVYCYTVKKSTKYFLNLENQKDVNGTVKKIIKNDIEVTDQLKIQHELRMFLGIVI